MNMSDLPPTAVPVATGIWVDPVSRSRFYVDPFDATLLLVRSWTDAERVAHNQSEANRAELLAAIRDRVTALRQAATDAGTFQASQTARAAEVAAYPVSAITPAAIQAEISQLHLDFAKVSANQVQTLGSLADLAMVVSGIVPNPPQ